MIATHACRVQDRHTHEGMSRRGWFGNCEPRVLFVSGTRGRLDEVHGLEDTPEDNFVGCGASIMRDGWRLSFHQQADLLSRVLCAELGLPCACWMVANLGEHQHAGAGEAGACATCRVRLRPGGEGEREVLALARRVRPHVLVSADRDLFNPFASGRGELVDAWPFPHCGVGRWEGHAVLVPPYKVSARFSCRHDRLDGRPTPWRDAWRGYARRAAPALARLLEAS